MNLIINFYVRTLFHAVLISVTTLIALAPQVSAAHPHDLLAQCQLPSGKWVMCDQTIDSPNGHVPKSMVKPTRDFKANSTGPGPKKKFVQQQAATPAVSGPAKFTAPFSVNCVQGFSKAGEQKMPNGDMDWYVCTTPVIKCPSYLQSNGKWAHVTPKAIVQLIGGNPDGGEQKFRVQYKCDYDFNAWPEG